MAFSILQLLLLPLFVVSTMLPIVTTDVLISNMSYIANTVLHLSYELEERWLSIEKNPCDDFYGYVCSKQTNDNNLVIPRTHLEAEEQFRKFLHTDNSTTYARQFTKTEIKVKNFYKSCLQARSLADLKATLMYRTSGGWPAIEDTHSPIFKRKNATWLHVLTAFHDVGAQPYVFKHRVEMKSNRRIVTLTPSEKERYTMRKYEQLTNEVLHEYQVDPARARLIALETLKFERALKLTHKSNNPKQKLKQREWNYTDFKSLAFQNVSTLDWDNYFKKLLGKSLKPNDTIYVRDFEEMQDVFNLLQNTSLARLLNWIWIDYLMDKNTSNCQNLTKKYFESVYENIVQHATINKLAMVNMYSELGRIFEEIFAHLVWIDEMSQQNSKQYLGLMMKLTQNGDVALDVEYKPLTIGHLNFYRNLEKVERHLASKNVGSGTFKTIAEERAANFMNIFLAVNHLMKDRNFTAPLSYILIGESFAENLIASGSTSKTVGAWRSMDSETDFRTFQQCIFNMSKESSDEKPDANALLLKSLSSQLGLLAMENWMANQIELTHHLDNLLATGPLKLSLRKLYFIGALLNDCQNDSMQKAIVNIYLKNSPKFTNTFNCSPSTVKYCKVF